MCEWHALSGPSTVLEGQLEPRSDSQVQVMTQHAVLPVRAAHRLPTPTHMHPFTDSIQSTPALPPGPCTLTPNPPAQRDGTRHHAAPGGAEGRAAAGKLRRRSGRASAAVLRSHSHCVVVLVYSMRSFYRHVAIRPRHTPGAARSALYLACVAPAGDAQQQQQPATSLVASRS